MAGTARSFSRRLGSDPRFGDRREPRAGKARLSSSMLLIPRFREQTSISRGAAGAARHFSRRLCSDTVVRRQTPRSDGRHRTDAARWPAPHGRCGAMAGTARTGGDAAAKGERRAGRRQFPARRRGLVPVRGREERPRQEAARALGGAREEGHLLFLERVLHGLGDLRHLSNVRGAVAAARGRRTRAATRVCAGAAVWSRRRLVDGADVWSQQ